MSPIGWYIVKTLISVIAICALAVLAIWGIGRAGAGRSAGPLQLVGRLPLDGRRAVYLVRIGKTVLVLGGSEAGINKLAEVPSDSVSLPALEAHSRSFRDVLARATGREPVTRVDRDDAA
ncbi:MAG TPA: flagellar biosynthetic protein FliO [Polyangiaceae bacterium]